MYKLVGLEETKAHLRIDTSDDDAYLELLINACSGAVNNYLKRDYADIQSDQDVGGDVSIEYDSDGVIDTEDEVKLACLYMIGVMYRDRDGELMKEWQHGYLPNPVMALLYPLRDPSLS